MLSAGCVIGASEIGVLATVGVTKVTCHQLPIVGIMSSGNEVCKCVTVSVGLSKCLGLLRIDFEVLNGCANVAAVGGR